MLDASVIEGHKPLFHTLISAVEMAKIGHPSRADWSEEIYHGDTIKIVCSS